MEKKGKEKTKTERLCASSRMRVLNCAFPFVFVFVFKRDSERFQWYLQASGAVSHAAARGDDSERRSRAPSGSCAPASRVPPTCRRPRLPQVGVGGGGGMSSGWALKKTDCDGGKAERRRELPVGFNRRLFYSPVVSNMRQCSRMTSIASNRDKSNLSYYSC